MVRLRWSGNTSTQVAQELGIAQTALSRCKRQAETAPSGGEELSGNGGSEGPILPLGPASDRERHSERSGGFLG